MYTHQIIYRETEHKNSRAECEDVSDKSLNTRTKKKRRRMCEDAGREYESRDL